MYASQDRAGSVAAPTAGLHFTDEVLQQLADKNVITSHMTLHVSAGTFRPVAVSCVSDHDMHQEVDDLRTPSVSPSLARSLPPSLSPCLSFSPSLPLSLARALSLVLMSFGLSPAFEHSMLSLLVVFTQLGVLTCCYADVTPGLAVSIGIHRPRR